MKKGSIIGKKISRRKFVLGVSATGTGLMMGLYPKLNAVSKMLTGNEYAIEGFTPNIWITVEKDNTVTITISRTEMGQGIRTALAMATADEMNADWKNVKVVQALADTKYGSQSTGGSQSIMTRLSTMRQAGAIVGKMFITAAAQTWGIAESNCKADMGYVIEVGGSRKLSFGELTDKASTLPIPGSATLKDAKDFKYIGTKIGHIDSHDIVTGKAIFGLDVSIPGMKYACIAFPPALGASVASFTDTNALKIPGVIRSVQISAGVAIIADNTYSAMKGVEALSINWNMGSNANLSSEQIFQNYHNGIGSLAALPGSTVKTIESTYQVPYLAHATMEPQNCTVNYTGTSCEVWVPTQDSQSVKSTVASAVGLSSNSVKVNTTLVGGGFGRRLSADYARYAAEISKKTNLPIKLTYTRADDMKWDNNYRAASVHALKSGLDSSGKLTGWIHKSVGVSPFSPPYTLPSPQNSQGTGSPVVPTGAWRSVSSTQVVFANESFIDEIALSAGVDPMAFRLSISNNSKITGVLNELKTRSGWTNQLPKGKGRGVAVFSGFGGYAGHVVEVTVDGGNLTIDRVIAVCDVGMAVNTNIIEAEMMGVVIDGLSTALKAEITIKKGIAEQSNFNDFRWLRIDESPKIEVYILQSGGFISGLGELGFPTVTPALTNAIFNACGVRVRLLPISKTELTSVDNYINNEISNLKLYPNPVADKLNIEFDAGIALPNEYKIEILDMQGRIIFEKSNLSAFNKIADTIEFPDVASGNYILKLKYGNKVATGKIIKI